MEKEKIDRINFLARKSKNEGLTDEEKEEQTILRNEYRNGFKMNFIEHLKYIHVVKD